MMKRTAALKVLAAAGVVSALLAGTAFAGTWSRNGSDWGYVDDRGKCVNEGWIYDNGSWYFFQPNASGTGVMQTGWVKDAGKWYFLDNTSRDSSGKLLTGWTSIDGDWYYLDPANGGAMATGTVVDGYRIDADGKAAKTSAENGVSRIIYVYEDGTTSESTAVSFDDEEEDFDAFTNSEGRTARRVAVSSSGSSAKGPGAALGSYYEYSLSMPSLKKETYTAPKDNPSTYSGSDYLAYADLLDDDDTAGSKDDFIKNNTSASVYERYKNSAKTPQKKIVNDDGSYYLYNSRTDSYDYYSKDGELEEDSEDEDDEDDEDDEE